MRPGLGGKSCNIVVPSDLEQPTRRSALFFARAKQPIPRASWWGPASRPPSATTPDRTTLTKNRKAITTMMATPPIRKIDSAIAARGGGGAAGLLCRHGFAVVEFENPAFCRGTSTFGSEWVLRHRRLLSQDSFPEAVERVRPVWSVQLVRTARVTAANRTSRWPYPSFLSGPWLC